MCQYVVHFVLLHYTTFLADLECLFFHMNFGIRLSSCLIRILLRLIHISVTISTSIRDVFPEGESHQLSSGSQLWEQGVVFSRGHLAMSAGSFDCHYWAGT